VEAIASLHSPTLVPTNQRGSKAIDGIFLSKTLISDARGGFLPFGEATISNHQVIWLDIQASMTGMDQSQAITQPKARRLKCQDPRIVHKYNEHLTQLLQEHQCLTWIEAVYQDGVTHLMHHKEAILEDIDQWMSTAKLEAEKQCRKYMQAGHHGHWDSS